VPCASQVPGEASSETAVLRDRIYRSAAASLPASVQPPPFPFALEAVEAAPVAGTPA
jgi:hypothetical protein